MKKMLILLFVTIWTFFVPTIIPAAFAAEELLTLDQAKELARNSRNLQQYQLDMETAKYRYYQAKDQYNDEKHTSYYNALNYYMYLIEQQGQGKNVDQQLEKAEQDLDAAKEKLSSDSDRIDSLKDSMEDAEDAYETSKTDNEKYLQQLDYLVEQLYTSILNQENSLTAQRKELDYKFILLNVERKKQQLGRTTQETVDNLAVETSTLNKTIIEQQNTLNTLQGEFNDLLGREYNVPLKLAPVTVAEAVLIPTYETLLARVSQNYDGISELEKDIAKKKDDLNDADDDEVAYQTDLIRIEIKNLELQIEDEKFNLTETVNSLITDLKIKQKNYQLAKIDQETARKKYEWDQNRFELGRLSKLDLLQSELDYLAIQNKSLSTEYDFLLAKHSLELAEQGILL
ncbi:MAG: TolC family protein [Peptococcaceae bacterium]